MCTALPDTWAIFHENDGSAWLYQVHFWSFNEGKYSPVCFNGDYMDDDPEEILKYVIVGREKAFEQLKLYAKSKGLVESGGPDFYTKPDNRQ